MTVKCNCSNRKGLPWSRPDPARGHAAVPPVPNGLGWVRPIGPWEPNPALNRTKRRRMHNSSHIKCNCSQKGVRRRGRTQQNKKDYLMNQACSASLLSKTCECIILPAVKRPTRRKKLQNTGKGSSQQQKQKQYRNHV